MTAAHLILLSILVKIVAAYTIPIVGDESYYWFWGQHPQLSYFDHPGMVGWMTWLGSKLTFLPVSLVVRWPFIVVSTLSLVLFYQIISSVYQNVSKTILTLLAFYLLNPMLGLGGIFATPDVPLVFFWTLSYWFVIRILEKQFASDYLYLGIALGLGFCSKYHIVLFPLTVLIGLFLSGQIKFIQPKKLTLTFLAGLIFSLPVLIWNANNDWASLSFQINHGFNGARYTPMWLLTYILGQFLLFNPVLFILLAKQKDPNITQTAALSQWGFFSLSSLRASVEANWPITAHAMGLSSAGKINHKHHRWIFFYWVIFWFLLISAIFTDFGKTKLNQLPQSLTAEKILPQLKEYSPLYGPTYQMSSLLHLMSGKEIFKLSQLSRIDFYDSKLFPQPTEKIFYSLKYDSSTWPEWLSEARFEQVEAFPEFSLSLYRVTRE